MEWKDKLTTWGGIATIAALFLTVGITSFNKLDADVKLSLEKIDRLHDLIYQDMKEFHRDMREFHGRLCAIEERSRK